MLVVVFISKSRTAWNVVTMQITSSDQRLQRIFMKPAAKAVMAPDKNAKDYQEMTGPDLKGATWDKTF